jgi:hexosaminidase
MTIGFQCEFSDQTILCDLTAKIDIIDPVWSFSLMSVGQVVSGADLVEQVGGYMALRLPTLVAGVPHRVVLTYKDGQAYKMNRAWFPLGNYLTSAAGVVDFDAVRQGVMDEPAPATAATSDLRLVPPVDRWLPADDPARRHSALAKVPSLSAVVALAERMNVTVFSDDSTATSVRCETDAAMSEGAYQLVISAAGVTITASGERGWHYGGISLLSLFLTYDGAVPNGVIYDCPRFQWRGQHLDCARHGFSKDTILRLLDLMAMMKLNKFHWHFADDEAFRIPLPSLPELTQLQTRGAGELVPSVFAAGPSAQHGYSHADVADIIAHAAALHIDVLPEIEIPAHSYGLCKLYPLTRDPDDTGTETSVQGYGENILNPAMPETWRIIENMISDLSQIFPFAHIHLGCDELPQDAWAGSPRVDALKRDFDLVSRDDVQGWMMERVAALATKYGCRPAAWEEAQYGKNGGIGHDAILFSWTGQGPGIAAARAGYDIVMCPAQHTYFDMAHSYDRDDWGATWAACYGVAETLNWDPVPAEAPDISDRVIGVQGTYWGEFTVQDHQFEPMIAPRILGLATTAWASDDHRKSCDIHGLVRAYAPIFAALNWRVHKNA